MDEEKIELVSDADKVRWHEFAKDGKTPTGVIDVKLVRHILKTYHIFVIGRMPYIYEDGVYRIDESETKLKEIIQDLIYDKFVTINTVNRVYNLLISTYRIQKRIEDINSYPRQWINFKNCMFDPIEWRMLAHDPKYLAINQIPHEFHIENQPRGDITKEFIDFAIPDEADREMLWQYFGYCMTVDSSLQKFLIFKGQGGTGKSQLIHIIEAIIGHENISNISLQQLNERFYPSMLLGKLVNSCADIPSRAMEAVDGIKKATGEDNLFAEKKGKDGFSFKSYAKLIFSANEIPINIEEKSEALYRRMLIIKVERKPEKKNRSLWKQLEDEIDYSIMEATKALHRMYQNGSIIESSNNRSNVEEVYMEADTVTAFLVERTTTIEGKGIKSSELYEEYKKYCEDLGRKVLSAHGFHKTLKNKGYEKKRTSGCERYEGLVILDESEFMSMEGYSQDELPFQ